MIINGVNTVTKPLIYITRSIPQQLLEKYKQIIDFRMWTEESIPVPRMILKNEIKKANGLLCLLTEQVDADLLEAATNLKIVANMAVGYDNIDIAAAKKKGIIVTNTPDVLTETTADLTFALLMTTARRIVEANNYIRMNKWEHWSPFLLAGSDIHHKTIGIVGMGRIGEAVARRAKGFKMSILYHNRNRNRNAEKELNATYVSLHTLVKESDFVVSLVPLTSETKQLFNKETFQTMKETAIFINASRGGVVDEKALYDALLQNEIKAAGLDVFSEEPIDSTHPLMQLENVVCLPHIGSASVETRTKMLELCLDNIVAVFSGKKPLTPVED